MVVIHNLCERVGEGDHWVEFYVFEHGFVSLDIGCECLVVLAWCGEIEVDELHHCLKVFRRAGAVHAFVIGVDEWRDVDFFTREDLWEVYCAEVAHSAEGDEFGQCL